MTPPTRTMGCHHARSGPRSRPSRNISRRQTPVRHKGSQLPRKAAVCNMRSAAGWVLAALAALLALLGPRSACANPLQTSKSYDIGTFRVNVINTNSSYRSTSKYTIELLKVVNASASVSVWSTTFSNEEPFISVEMESMFATTENSGNFNVTDLPDLRSHGQTLTK